MPIETGRGGQVGRTPGRDADMNAPARPSQLLFLPGALGRTRLWAPLAERLTCPVPGKHLGWPGFGGVPPDPGVNGIEDLVRKVCGEINRPSALLAQSMGGAIAIRAAIEKPGLITHLVLAVTSGGVDVAGLGGQDWRPAFCASHPELPDWFCSYREDLSVRLAEVGMPVLLLWGDCDPICPVAVGERLASLLPRACLRIVPGGDHDLVETHAAMIAPVVDEFLLGHSACRRLLR